MGDARTSDDPFGFKDQTQEVETKILVDSIPEESILGLTLMETKKKIKDIFNNLEVKSVSLSSIQTAILVVPYPTACPTTKLPAFYALAERSGNAVVRLELTTFHGKVLMSENLTTELDILESAILTQFADDKLRLCMGRKGSRRELLGTTLIEYLGADIVHRSRKCLYIAHEEHGETCAACSVLVEIKNELGDTREEDRLFTKNLRHVDVTRSEMLYDEAHDPSKVSLGVTPLLTIAKTDKCQTKRSIHSEQEGFDVDFNSDFIAHDDFEDCEDLHEGGGDTEFQPAVNQSGVGSEQRRIRMKFKDTTEDQDLDEVVVKKEDQEEISTPVEEDSKSSNRVPKISYRDLEYKINELMVGGDEGSKKLRRKMKEQLGSKEPICPRCDKPYKSKTSFVKHLRQCILGAQNELDMSFECKVCLAVLSSQQTFDNHMQLHHSRIDLKARVECPECSENLESKMLLTQHYRSRHDPTKGVCPICLFVTDGSTLARHLKKKHFLKHHLCNICGKEFDLLLKMQVHMSTAHAEITGSTRIVCEQCGKTFAHKERLRQHRAMVHVNNTAKQQCQFCGKVCQTLHALYKHKKIHSKTKPWQCSLCDYRAVVRGNVSLHMRKVHKKEGIAYHDIIRIGDYTY